jgi:CBS domain-containing protein
VADGADFIAGSTLSINHGRARRVKQTNGNSAMTYRNMSDIVRDQNPVVLSSSTTVQQACQRMRERRVGAILVTEGERHLVGIFTGRDAVCRVLAEGKEPSKVALKDVMTANPDTLLPSNNAIDALRLMQNGGYRHVPIVENGEVAGIVSRGDFRGIELDRLDEETGLWERI